MFILAQMKDVVQIKPFNFVHGIRDSLEFGLNKKFANKVKHTLCSEMIFLPSYVLIRDNAEIIEEGWSWNIFINLFRKYSLFFVMNDPLFFKRKL